jgi:RND family efflux transporter MFP subunit
VLELIDLESLRIDVQVPQERFAELQAGAEFQLLPDADGGRRLPARLEALLPVVDASARTFLLRLQPLQADGSLLAGGSTRVEIALPAREPALAISRDALLRRPDGSHALFVLERTSDGGWLARERSVRVLRDAGTQVAIAEGLKEGDQVVVRGNEALRDGQAVELAGD